MNTHKNARLTFARRVEMVRKVIAKETRIGAAAIEQGVSEITVRKWVRRYSLDGIAGLLDRPSRPHHSPAATHQSIVQKILELRRMGRTMQTIANDVGRSLSTVSRVCSGAGLSRRLKAQTMPQSQTDTHVAARHAVIHSAAPEHQGIPQ